MSEWVEFDAYSKARFPALLRTQRTHRKKLNVLRKVYVSNATSKTRL